MELFADGRLAKTYYHRGENFVLGQKGKRYTLRIHNRTSRRVEAVVSVDGRDVVDGKLGHFRKRGYLVSAWGYVDIDGWRLSQNKVAAFRFSSVANSYAAKMGSARNVGVIGVAIFPERRRRRVRRPPYIPHYRQRSHDDLSSETKTGRAPSASSGSSSEASSAPAPSAEDSASASRSHRSRPGLGTSFGEEHISETHEVSFVRANAHSPSRVLGLRYNDYDGLLAMGVRVRPRKNDVHRRKTANPFPLAQKGFSSPPPGWRP
jgi:hypothetical protein